MSLLVWIKLILVTALLGFIGWQQHEIDSAEKALFAEKSARQEEKILAAAAALKQSEEYRAIADQLQAVKEQAQHEYDAAQTRNASALAAARADSGKLRNQLAAFAAGSSSAAPDTVAACDQRAAALGGLLAAALQSDAERTAAAEGNGDAVRTLLAAWPTERSPSVTP